MDTFAAGSGGRNAFSASVLSLTLLASPALAQPADRPNVKVGDQWRLARITTAGPSLEWIVTAVSAAEIKATENGEPLLLTPALNVLDSPRRTDSERRLLSFPLEVGKSWTYVNDYALKDTGMQGRVNGSVVVLSYEKIRVRAGEFDAFKLESTGSFSGTSHAGPISGASTTTYWYAPTVRAIVRGDIDDPNRGRYGFELVQFKLQP